MQPEPSPGQPEPSPVQSDPIIERKEYNQKASVYLCVQKDNKNDKSIPLHNGKIRGKFGVTEQSPTKRLSGGILQNGYELQSYDEVGEFGMERVTNDYNQTKWVIEIDLYNSLVCVTSVEFEQNSTEIFYYLPEDRFKIRDYFNETVIKYRPTLKVIDI